MTYLLLHISCWATEPSMNTAARDAETPIFLETLRMDCAVSWVIAI